MLGQSTILTEVTFQRQAFLLEGILGSSPICTLHTARGMGNKLLTSTHIRGSMLKMFI